MHGQIDLFLGVRFQVELFLDLKAMSLAVRSSERPADRPCPYSFGRECGPDPVDGKGDPDDQGNLAAVRIRCSVWLPFPSDPMENCGVRKTRRLPGQALHFSSSEVPWVISPGSFPHRRTQDRIEIAWRMAGSVPSRRRRPGLRMI